MLVIPARGGPVARRPAAGGGAGAALPAGRVGRPPGRDLGGGRGRATRWSPACCRPAPPAHAGPPRSPSRTTCAAATSSRSRTRLAERPVRACLDRSCAELRMRQGPRRDRPADPGRPRRGPGRRPDRRAAGSSAGPRPTSPTRSAGGWSPRATTRRSSPSSGPGPNSASPHHEASDRVIAGGRADRARHRRTCSAATARTSPGRCGSPAATRPRARTSGSATCSASCIGAQAAATRGGPAGRRLRGGRRRGPPADRGRGLRRGVLPPDRPRDRARGPRGAVHHRAATREPLEPGMAFSVEPGIYLVGRVRRADRGHRGVRAGRPDRAQRGAARALRRRRLIDARSAGLRVGGLRYHQATGCARCVPSSPSEIA